MTIKLSLATLPQAADNAATPAYARASLKAGIVHYGVGNFHRAHQAMYLDDLFAQGEDQDWAIVGAGMLPSDARMREKLAPQDFLTTIVERDNDRTAARVIAPMIDFLPVGDAAAIIACMAEPAIRIVSLTITEGGYFIDVAGKFNPAHPAIVADAANPDVPKTAFGILVAALKLRRERGLAPFTIMSCDNIPHNGAVTAHSVIGTAQLSDPALADWIKTHVAFPNSMVDRITPATGEREISHLKEHFGIDDNWPVYCEFFRQWVMEDKFPAGRPALEKVGVTFVPDVAPFELMKIRILNGGHAAIAYPAALLDFHFVHEAMQDPVIRGFLAKLEKDEIIPVIPPVPGVHLPDYYDQVEGRFLNNKIADTIARLAQDGSNRQPKFILPSTRDRLAKGLDITGLALVSALWCKYLTGASDSGRPIEIADVRATELRAAAIAAKHDPAAFLALPDIFGELAASEVFVQKFSHALQRLWSEGTRHVLLKYAEGRFS